MINRGANGSYHQEQASPQHGQRGGERDGWGCQTGHQPSHHEYDHSAGDRQQQQQRRRRLQSFGDWRDDGHFAALPPDTRQAVQDAIAASTNGLRPEYSERKVQLLPAGLAPQVLRPVLAEFASVNFAGVRRPTGYLVELSNRSANGC